MSIGVETGVLLALGTAAASVIGFLYKHRGAVEAPAVDWRQPLRSSLVLFRSRAYTLGIAIATASWGLHVAALSLAPISLVQTVIAGGLVLLTVFADRLFGLPVSRREWVGVALTAVGLALLAATLDRGTASAHSHYAGTRLTEFELAVVAAGALAGLASVRWRRPGLPLAVSAGLLWAGSDVCIKALSGHLGARGAGVLADPLALVILILSLTGMLVSAASLQAGPAIPVIAATSAAANVTTIAAGPVVFHDPLPHTTGGLALRLLAFVLVVVAAMLTPGPVSAVSEKASGVG